MRLMRIGSVGEMLAIFATAAIVTAAGYHVSAKDDDRAQDDDAYTIALFGDMPYNALGKAQYPALLADVNRAHVAFSVHDGDLKAGGDGPCSDSLYYTGLNYFNT